MGQGRVNLQDLDNRAAALAHSTVSEIFRKTAEPQFLPIKITLRESCETAEKPRVIPIIVALDVTGSMGKIPQLLVQGGLSTLIKNILELVPNPHIMFMAVGDVVAGDKYPLQATQFEADNRIADQLQNLVIEGGGGGNGSESYPLAWHFAYTKISLDCYKHRKEKGFLFTIGDDASPFGIEGHDIKIVMGAEAPYLKTIDILKKAEAMYEVFHLLITENKTCTEAVQNSWQELLGERAISVADYTKVPEFIVGTVKEVIANRSRAKPFLPLLSSVKEKEDYDVKMDIDDHNKGDDKEDDFQFIEVENLTLEDNQASSTNVFKPT